jgi:predicted RNA binding protein with dsRBD fold (UPF0201 family)
MTIRVQTEINPTETAEKVEKAITNIFGHLSKSIKPFHNGDRLNAEAIGQETLIRLRNLLSSDRIRSAARKMLFDGIRGKSISFCLNKQVAFAGHVSFSEEVAESPLGPIKVKIQCENPRQLINWLAPCVIPKSGGN